MTHDGVKAIVFLIIILVMMMMMMAMMTIIKKFHLLLGLCLAFPRHGAPRPGL